MEQARWQQIGALFDAAIERPVLDRAAFLQDACAGDTELLSAVSDMLQADSASDILLDRDLADVSRFAFDGSKHDLSSLHEIGPYRLERQLGEGGMGVVWLAKRADTGSLVAIKLLLHARWSHARRQRFNSEIRTLAKLNHHLIARLFDAGSLDDGTPWFVMEYVDGLTLNEYCAEKNLTTEARLKLFRSVCNAVQYAHSQEIIHRDLKPSNILVQKNGQPKLLDFGIARQLNGLNESAGMTRPGLRMMTPEYAAPEWIADGTLGFFTDVYSLGVVLFQMLNGSLPPRDYAGAQSDLERLCAKAIARYYKERYSSVEAFARDVDHYLRCEPLESRPRSLRYSVTKFVTRNRRAVAISACALVALVCLLVAFTWRLARAQNATLEEARRTKEVERFLLALLEGGDKVAGPSNHLQVATLLDRGVRDAQRLGATPAIQAEVYRTLGRSYQELGEFDTAEKLLESSLRMNESVSGAKSAESGQVLLDLGLLEIDRGRFDEAESYLQKSLDISRKRQDDRALALATSALGRLAYERGNTRRALQLLKSAIERQTNLRDGGADLAVSLSNLSDTSFRLGDYANADDYMRKSMALHKQLFGDAHPSVAENLGNLGNIQIMWGRYDRAEDYFRQSLAIYRNYYGENHPKSAVMLGYVAQSLMYQKRNAEAEPLYWQALHSTEQVYGSSHPKVALALTGLGAVHQRLGKIRMAISENTRAFDIYRASFGEEHEFTLIAMGNLATVYMESKQYVKAEPMFRKAVLLFSKVQSPTHLNTGIARMKLGRTLLGQKKFREAEAETLASLEILRRITAPTNGFIQADWSDLAKECAALGEPEKAEFYRKELVASER